MSENPKDEDITSMKLWEIADRRSGRPLIFETPYDLWSACVGYFEWAEANPLKEAKAFAYEGVVTEHELPKMRALTIGGLCLYLGINQETWRNYRMRDGFLGVVTRAEEAIREQKFVGAAADLLNPNIIARDLGLRDRDKIEDDEAPVPQKIVIEVKDCRTDSTNLED